MLHRAFNVMFEVSGGVQHWTERCRDVLHAKMEERTRERDEAEQVLDFARAKFENYFEEYGAVHSDGTCPEDDTCRCPLVVDLELAFKRINAALERSHK